MSNFHNNSSVNIISTRLLHDISQSNLIPHYSELLGNDIAIIGMSANPPTGYNGHMGIMKYFYSSGLFDEIWILPVYQHIFNAKRSMESYEHRLNMLQLCVDAIIHDHGDVDIDETGVRDHKKAATCQCKLRLLRLEKAASEYYHSLHGDSYRVGTIDVLDYINIYYTIDDNTVHIDDSIIINETSNSTIGINKGQGGSLKLNLILGMDTYIDFCSMKWKDADRYD